MHVKNPRPLNGTVVHGNNRWTTTVVRVRPTVHKHLTPSSWYIVQASYQQFPSTSRTFSIVIVVSTYPLEIFDGFLLTDVDLLEITHQSKPCHSKNGLPYSQQTRQSPIHCLCHTFLPVWRGLGMVEVEGTAKAEYRKRTCCNIVCWPTAGLAEGIFGNSGFSVRNKTKQQLNFCVRGYRSMETHKRKGVEENGDSYEDKKKKKVK